MITIVGVVSNLRRIAGKCEFDLSVTRWSGNVDRIKCVGDTDGFATGDTVKIKGEITTENYTGSDEKRHLKLYVYCNFVELAGNPYHENYLKEEGHICKIRDMRETQMSHKKITEFILAVNSGNKTSYIPCIAWNENAKKAENMKIGAKVIVTGRLQSRIYAKQTGDGLYDLKTAYEVSVSGIKEV